MRHVCEHNWEVDELFEGDMFASFRCTLCGRVEESSSNDITYRLSKRAQVRRQITTRKSVQNGEADRLADLLDEASNEIANLRRWKEAILNELITCHILSSKHMENPVQALNDAINWNVEVALDPAVSERAQALIEQGRWP